MKLKTISKKLKKKFYFKGEKLLSNKFSIEITKLTCKAVKNGKYMSGTSYFPFFASTSRVNCRPKRAEKKYAYRESVTTYKQKKLKLFIKKNAF